MLHQLITIPRSQHFYLACSGGVDSMVVADFYHRGNKNFTLAYFNHNTPASSKFEETVRTFADKNSIPFVTASISGVRTKDSSQEEWWRVQRYEWLHSLKEDVITAHHLNDVAETWIFSSLHGNPKIILPRWKNIVRPFLTTTRAEILQWANDPRHPLTWCEDTTNDNIHFPRNNIRHRILPLCLEINPGLLKVMKKKVFATLELQ
jgi:tRNA(Ile)-lysidine synthase